MNNKIIIYFSGHGESKNIASYVNQLTNYSIYDFTSCIVRKEFDYSEEFDLIIFVFPVYSEAIPKVLMDALLKLKTKYLILLATYGKMGTGNVIYEIAKRTHHHLVGAMYVPCKHTYLNEERFNDFQQLNVVLEMVNNTKELELDSLKRKKHFFADFFRNFRTRKNVSIQINNKCVNCKICERNCPVEALKEKKMSKACLRCLKCYYNCPHQAIDIKYSLFLKKYLTGKKDTNVYIYK